MAKEAKSRIKINKLLEESGWRFFDSLQGQANISLEVNTKLTEQTLNGLGEDFEKTNNGFIDFLLLDEKSFPLAVLEAKSEEKNPLDGKEQAEILPLSRPKLSEFKVEKFLRIPASPICFFS